MREEAMSAHEHWSEDALLNALYGLAEEGAWAHLRECPACAKRWSEWQQKRASLAGNVEISDEFLAAQRRKIYERLERPPRKRLVWAWAPALVAACVLAVGVFLYHPAPQSGPAPAAPHTEISDAQLFGEFYSMEQTMEPSAAAPMHSLFAEPQSQSQEQE
jgi:anti-sigma factor RsiW